MPNNILIAAALLLSVPALMTIFLYFLQKVWCRIFGSKAVYLTGWVGTPVHEISHVLMCFIFNHKVIDVALFKPEPESGVLGYVTHSYNSRSLYQRVGCLFVGLAPLLGNLGLAYFLYLKFEGLDTASEPLQVVSYIYLITCLILHAAPSPADLKGATTGLVALAVAMIPVYLVWPGVIESVSNEIITNVTELKVFHTLL